MKPIKPINYDDIIVILSLTLAGLIILGYVVLSALCPH